MSGDQLSPLQKAVKVIAAQRKLIDAAEARQRAPLAIIGMGCRYPGGVNTPDELWALFREAQCPVQTRPEGRPSWGEMKTAPGFFIDDADRFDAAHFGVSPREARLMDPQQRVLLEVAHQAFDHAGLAPSELAGRRCGVFIGAMAVDYATLAQRTDLMDVHTGTGTSPSILAGRLSHQFDLRGPSVTINTSCSSSLVAVHQAMSALRRGECDLAIAGGVNLILTPEVWQIETAAGMLAPDGICKAFDDAADGFGRGEGCGLVVLKRLDDAMRDGDRVHAVILGSAVNHDGRAAGIMVPNPHAQAEVMRAALGDAGVAPPDVSYVETHGTGTRLGDPIEAEALSEVYGAGREIPLIIGAAKANLGHTEGAAGITSLLRLVLALRAGQWPPQRLTSKPSTVIDWDAARLRLAGQEETAPAEGRTIGAVSSFGFSGTNAHVIVAAPETRPSERTLDFHWADTRYWVPELVESPAHATVAKEPAGQLYRTTLVPVEVAKHGVPTTPVRIINRGLVVGDVLADVLKERAATVTNAASFEASDIADGEVIVFCVSGDIEADVTCLRAIVAVSGNNRIAAVAEFGNPAGEAVVAYLRSVFVDHPARAGTLILAEACAEPERIVDALSQTTERQIVVREDGMFAPRLAVTSNSGSGHYSASAERPYLVTGGFGSLGQEIAGWLVAHGARHLVLLGRRTPSEDVRICDIANDAALWSRILGWRASGVKVDLVGADVGDRDAMHRVVAVDYPALAGVVHAAGVSNVGTDDEDLSAVLHAKVKGTAILEELLEGRSLDLMLFCSSAAVWGGDRLASYAAANAYMDATARRMPGAISVQFGGWQGSRMLSDENLRAYQERRGFRALPPSRMLALLDAALMQGEPVIAAVDLDAVAYRRSLKPSGLDRFMDGVSPDEHAGKTDHRDVILAAHPRRRDALVFRLAQQLAAELLGHPDPDALAAETPLQDLGFNSLMALEFRDGLTARLGVELSSTLIYANPTLRAVTDHITELLSAIAPPPQRDERIAEAHARLSKLLARQGS